MTDVRPILELSRNNAGHAMIGVTEFDERGYGVRSYVLSSGHEHVADRIMRRRFDDMARLMGDNVRTAITEDFTSTYSDQPTTVITAAKAA